MEIFPFELRDALRRVLHAVAQRRAVERAKFQVAHSIERQDREQRARADCELLPGAASRVRAPKRAEVRERDRAL